MYELIQVANNTYYVNCPAKIGVYRCNDTDIFSLTAATTRTQAARCAVCYRPRAGR